jgi:hypothetical protein
MFPPIRTLLRRKTRSFPLSKKQQAATAASSASKQSVEKMVRDAVVGEPVSPVFTGYLPHYRSVSGGIGDRWWRAVRKKT